MLKTLLEAYTGFFSILGLSSPFTRFLFGSALGFAGQLIVKPSLSYKRDGTAKKFISETFFPWYVISLIPGAIFGLLL